jgi:type IV pilus assembly protein PilV
MRRHSATAPAAASRQRGLTLIEVLIALLVLSFGVLGMAMLQARALQYLADAEDRGRAARLVDELVSQMWLNRTVSLPTATVDAWKSRVQDPTVSGLSGSTIAISAPDALGVVTITLTWLPPYWRTSDLRSDLDKPSYSTKVVIP